jgi:AbrB family looped-hinge helix DNA binding protein
MVVLPASYRIKETTMNIRAKISSKGQVVVPKEIRDRLGFAEGSEVEFLESGDGVLLKSVPSRASKFPPITFDEFKARRVIWRGTPVTNEDIDQAIASEVRRRWREKSA